MKQKIVLIISGGMGFLAFVLTHFYLAAEREALYEGTERVPVLVARQNLTSGHTVTREDITEEPFFEAGLGRDVFRAEQRNMVIGRTLQYPVRRGDQLRWVHVGANLDEITGLSPMVRSGMRAISIPVSGETAVSGLVRPNDKVDILGTFSFVDQENPAEMETVTFTVLQDVTVLATGQDTGRQEMEITGGGRRRGSYNTVTISVFPPEAELLAFAMNVQGNLTLTLRNPRDISVMDESPPIDFETLQRELPRLNERRQRQLRDGDSPDVLRR